MCTISIPMNPYAKAERMTYAHIERDDESGQYVLVNNRHPGMWRTLLLDPVIECGGTIGDAQVIIISTTMDDGHPADEPHDHIVFGQLVDGVPQEYLLPVYFQADYNTCWFEQYQHGTAEQKLVIFGASPF